MMQYAPNKMHYQLINERHVLCNTVAYIYYLITHNKEIPSRKKIAWQTRGNIEDVDLAIKFLIEYNYMTEDFKLIPEKVQHLRSAT